jgi:hypothetical protein
VPVALPALIRVAGSARKCRGTTLNLSCRGIFCITPEPYPVGEKLQVFVQLPEELSPDGGRLQLRCSVSVVRSEPPGPGQQYGFAAAVEDYRIIAGEPAQEFAEEPAADEN